MKDLETAWRMFKAAGRDYLALKNMLDSSIFAPEIFGFCSQQVVEKCLKAWLSLEGIQYPKTHNIRHLIVLLDKDSIDKLDLWDFVGLTSFAVIFRYEPFEEATEDLERESILCKISVLYTYLENLLKSAT